MSVFMKDKIDQGISALRYLEIIEEPASKIIGLVQENQWFFDNPRLGEEALRVAADKLEVLINAARERR